MPTNVILNKGEIPSNSCFTTVPELYDLFINSTSAEVAGNYSLFNYGDSVPSTEDTDKPWIRTVSGQPDRLYYYYNGAWVSKHPVAYVSGTVGERRIFVGAAADINTYDGGSGSLSEVTLTTGPFWEKDAEFNAKFPVGIGETENGTEITESDRTGGSDQIKLQEQNLPPPGHTVKYTRRDFHNGSEDTGEGTFIPGSKSVDGMVSTGPGFSGTPFKNLPPYYGVYFIKRTARAYYTVV